MVKKWMLKKTNLGFELSTLDYPSLKVYENNSLYFYLILGPISEVRTRKQSSNQADNFFSKTLLYEKENNMWMRK
jgi:hypothetical protein